MFDDPEYASYIELCRELRLEPNLDRGDSYVSTREGHVWLPRLDQWLAMLEQQGRTSFYWEKVPSNGWYRLYLSPTRNEWPFGPTGVMTGSPTREEAAARLWMAVTRTASAPVSR